MTHADLLLIGMLRALVEVAMLTLLGQGLLALLAGAQRDGNPIYVLFKIVTGPAVRATRWLMPKMVIDKHIPFVAFFLLFWLWIFLAYVRQLLST